MPLIGMFANLAQDDREILARSDAFLAGLGPQSNLRIAHRFGAHVRTQYKKIADELVHLNPQPSAILATCWPTMRALKDATQTMLNPIPIVFAGLVNPAGALLNPPYRYANNITGIVSHDLGLCGQWLGKLRALVPGLQRVAVVYDTDPTNSTMDAQYNAIATSASGTSVAVSKIDARQSDAVLEDALATFGSTANGGLIVPTSTLTATRRNLIVGHATKYKLPALYPNRMGPINGGLLSYGPILIAQYGQAGRWVQSILNGALPSSITPVVNTNFETVINLKAATDIGLSLTDTAVAAVIAAADLVIQ